MEKYTVIYLGKKTDVIGNYQLFNGEPDFCCNLVKEDNKVLTYKLDTPDFTAIEKLVLIERKKGIILNN